MARAPATKARMVRMGRMHAKRRRGRKHTKNPTHYFSRVVNNDNFTLVNTVSSGGVIQLNNQGFLSLTMPVGGAGTQYFSISFAFCLSDVPDPSEFTSLFDRWQLNGVNFKVCPLYNIAEGIDASTTVANGSIAGFLHSVIDYDDYGTFAASEAGLDLMREYETYQTRNLISAGNKPMTRYIKPHTAVALSASGVFTSYGNQKKQWCDAGSPGVSHFGLKLLFQIYNPNNVANNITFLLEAKYFLAFKDLR